MNSVLTERVFVTGKGML